ncbi:MAG: hypothetical protein F6K56_40010, partial [Moorea sp. SIO3G5]|nr:hypothetical protein [Moorena sp. SIO3G5]
PTPHTLLPTPCSLKNLLQKFSKYVIILFFLWYIRNVDGKRPSITHR